MYLTPIRHHPMEDDIQTQSISESVSMYGRLVSRGNMPVDTQRPLHSGHVNFCCHLSFHSCQESPQAALQSLLVGLSRRRLILRAQNSLLVFWEMSAERGSCFLVWWSVTNLLTNKTICGSVACWVLMGNKTGMSHEMLQSPPMAN